MSKSKDSRTCVQCGKSVPGKSWHPQECCVGGVNFACSAECALTYAAEKCGRGATVEECIRTDGGVARFAVIRRDE